MQSLISRSVIGRAKVVGESTDAQQNLELDVEQNALMIGQLLGDAVANTICRAVTSVGLTVDHLLAPLSSLAVDAGTADLVRHGCERLIAEDYVSSIHILVPRVEDVLRQQLKSSGVDTTEFQRDVGDGTSRTDDAPLGVLMRKSLSDGRTAREYLGGDLWDHLDSVLNFQAGLNLRNNVAPGHTTVRPRPRGSCTRSSSCWRMSRPAATRRYSAFRLGRPSSAQATRRRRRGVEVRIDDKVVNSDTNTEMPLKPFLDCRAAGLLALPGAARLGDEN